MALTALLAAAGCTRDVPEGAFVVKGKLFVFNYREAQATYLVTVEKSGAVPEGTVLTAFFEDPAGGADVTATARVFEASRRLSLESPPVACVRKNRPYRVTIRAEAPATGIMQELATTVTSTLDQSILPAKPLTDGPGYQPNPDVFQSDGSRAYGKTMLGCPDEPALPGEPALVKE